MPPFRVVSLWNCCFLSGPFLVAFLRETEHSYCLCIYSVSSVLELCSCVFPIIPCLSRVFVACSRSVWHAKWVNTRQWVHLLALTAQLVSQIIHISMHRFI